MTTQLINKRVNNNII